MSNAARKSRSADKTLAKRDRIVESAAQRFRHYGIGKTTMAEIAQDAGVAVGTLYLHFKDKDDLVVACAEKFAGRHREECAAILASAQPVDKKLRRYIVGRFHQSEETRTSSRHAAEITRAVLRVKPDRILEEGEMMRATVTQLLREGVEKRQFRIADIDRDALVFLYSISYFFPNALTTPAIVPTEADLRLVIDWFLKTWQSQSKGARTKRPRRARSS